MTYIIYYNQSILSADRRMESLKSVSSKFDFWRADIAENYEKSVYVTTQYEKDEVKEENEYFHFGFYFFYLCRENGNVSKLEILNWRISAFVLYSSFIVLEFRIVLEAFSNANARISISNSFTSIFTLNISICCLEHLKCKIRSKRKIQISKRTNRK